MTPYEKVLFALICPCGECPLDPALWECRDCASAEELEAAAKAYKMYLEAVRCAAE